MPSRIKNLGIAGMAALSGCASLVIVLGALVLGLWLDGMLAAQPRIATLCLLILSVPVSLFIMVRIALALVAQIEPPAVTNQEPTPNKKEE